MPTTRRRYRREVLAVLHATTTSRDLNVDGLSSALTLANELLTDYTAHVANQGASAGEHKALHTAGVLSITSSAYDLTTLLALTNDLQTKYALHNTDAAATTPTYHIAQATTRALSDATAVTTLAGAITKLNDIKTKYNLHQADSTAHRTGNLNAIAATNAALGVSIRVTTGMSEVKIGCTVCWSILNRGTGTVNGVSAVAADGSVVFTFSADPQDDTVISCSVFSE